MSVYRIRGKGGDRERVNSPLNFINIHFWSATAILKPPPLGVTNLASTSPLCLQTDNFHCNPGSYLYRRNIHDVFDIYEYWQSPLSLYSLYWESVEGRVDICRVEHNKISKHRWSRLTGRLSTQSKLSVEWPYVFAIQLKINFYMKKHFIGVYHT